MIVLLNLSFILVIGLHFNNIILHAHHRLLERGIPHRLLLRAASLLTLAKAASVIVRTLPV